MKKNKTTHRIGQGPIMRVLEKGKGDTVFIRM